MGILMVRACQSTVSYHYLLRLCLSNLIKSFVEVIILGLAGRDPEVFNLLRDYQLT